MAKYFKSYISDSIWTTFERYWPIYFDIPFVDGCDNFFKSLKLSMKGFFYGIIWEGIDIRSI